MRLAKSFNISIKTSVICNVAPAEVFGYGFPFISFFFPLVISKLYVPLLSQTHLQLIKVKTENHSHKGGLDTRSKLAQILLILLLRFLLSF